MFDEVIRKIIIGTDIAFYKSNGERINSNSCKITY
jgi:hypothetical protein